jgi:uncharacterized protein involved in exopolysaccharide biosynthesis
MNSLEAIPHRPEDDSFDVRASLRGLVAACRQHRFLVAATTFASLLMMIAYIAIWPPVYKAEVLIYAETKDDPLRTDFYWPWDVFRKDDLRAEAELITARPVLESVVKRLGLTYDDVYHPPMSYAGHLWSTSLPGRGYRAIKEVLFPPKKGPYDPPPDEMSQAQTVNDLKAGVRLTTVADANIGRYAVRGPTPRVAEIANALIDSYIRQRRERHVREASEATTSLQAEVEKARNQLADVETTFQRFCEDNDLVMDLDKDHAEIGRWLDLRSSILELESEVASRQKNYDDVVRQLKSEDREAAAAGAYRENQLLEQMRSLKLQLELQMKAALLMYRSDAPEIAELRRRIETIGSLMGGQQETLGDSTKERAYLTYEELHQRQVLLESELAGARANLLKKQQVLQQVESRMTGMPQKLTVYRSLVRERQSLETKYTVLQEKLMMAQVSVATALSSPPTIQVADYARPPAKPVWPKKRLLSLLALVLGLMAGVGLAITADALGGYVTRERLLRPDAPVPVFASVELSVHNEKGRGVRCLAAVEHPPEGVETQRRARRQKR